MTEYVRFETDSRGGTVDAHLFCDVHCWADSLDRVPPVERDGWEEGGAWPCWDAPYDTYCDTCGALVAAGRGEEVAG